MLNSRALGSSAEELEAEGLVHCATPAERFLSCVQVIPSPWHRSWPNDVVGDELC